MADDTTGSGGLCKRCNRDQANQQIRNEKVCNNCFIQYVKTKAVKRIESYRGRGLAAPKACKKMLFPISFGPCSTSLLYIMDHQLKTQLERMGRASYELHLVHVNLDTERDSHDSKDLRARLEKVEARFPGYQIESVALQDAVKLDGIDWASLGLHSKSEKSTNPEGSSSEENHIEEGDVAHFLSSINSATSRADIIATLLTRLLVDVAKKKSCEGIFLGDSTTRLAERTLVQIAKGRGFSIPWQVSDGQSPWQLDFFYPLRELLKKEVVVFSSLIRPPIDDLIIFQESTSRISASAKTTTIDDLMAQYFESVEENYPSVVTNVVRTSGKLNPPDSDVESADCVLCGLPVARGTDGVHGWGGDQNLRDAAFHDSAGHANLCYGCARSLKG